MHSPRCSRRRGPEVVAVDVPIGLPERGSRDCDVEARRLLGVRSSSVFPAPIRAMLAAGSQAEASRIGHGAEGKRVSIQLWTAERIFAGIAISIPAAPPLDAHGLRMEMMA
jgi:predicted RNase H-like nuclease